MAAELLFVSRCNDRREVNFRVVSTMNAPVCPADCVYCVSNMCEHAAAKTATQQ